MLQQWLHGAQMIVLSYVARWLEVSPPTRCLYTKLGMSDMVPAETIKTTRSIVVSCGEKVQPWVIADVDIIDGVEYLALKSTDGGFHRLVTGTSRGITNSNCINKLKDLRANATAGISTATAFGDAMQHS